MAGDSDTTSNTTHPAHTDRENPEPASEGSMSPAGDATDRSELISRARIFLSSPQIQNQDIFAKRAFLLEKGLNEYEIEQILREMSPSTNLSSTPPSGLLTMLIGLARLFVWISGGSAALLLLYHRYVLPRIIRTAEARRSLKSHQVGLLLKLNASLKSFKEVQTDSYAVLPQPNPHKEPASFAGCHGLMDVLKEAETQKLELRKVPHSTLLRCAWEDYRKLPDCANLNPRTEELFQVLESRIPWLVSDEGIAFEHSLWDTLSTTSAFEGTVSQDSPENFPPPVRWAYIPPKPTQTTPFISSLESLSRVTSTYTPTPTSSYQPTLQTMSEFTGYISSNLYTPYRPPPLPGTVSPSTGDISDGLKKEIRALKGLALNRRSFMPTIPRPSFSTQPS
ncbi:hypothetical protein D9757_001316 [Collybiopsis confluens]|uniref:Peroxisome membrane anchor protein Pex14p N-terminal domain-containing protein n=1 Tax=Collybiopsis confluens TaxID=2823264 RepID=A0A8H5MFX7_9AGAR|nr:hypothetical protein D9757_001316 [Collybiopsis confluens]